MRDEALIGKGITLVPTPAVAIAQTVPPMHSATSKTVAIYIRYWPEMLDDWEHDLSAMGMPPPTAPDPAQVVTALCRGCASGKLLRLLFGAVNELKHFRSLPTLLDRTRYRRSARSEAVPGALQSCRQRSHPSCARRSLSQVDHSNCRGSPVPRAPRVVAVVH